MHYVVGRIKYFGMKIVQKAPDGPKAVQEVFA
jgi:hypothetical protein